MLVDQRTESRSGMPSADQCRLATIATPNVSNRFVPAALTVKTMFAPGITAQDSPAIEQTVGVPWHVPSSAPHGVTTVTVHAGANSGASEPEKRLAAGAQSESGVGRVQRRNWGGVRVSR